MPALTATEFAARIKSWSKDFRKSSQSWRQFKETGSDAARFRLAYSWPSCDVVIDVRRKPSQVKSSDEAKGMLRLGGEHAAKKQFNHALTAYNHAVVAAPWTEKEESSLLTLVFDRRSAVFLLMKRFADCVRDVDDALILGSAPKRRRKLLIRKVKALTSAGWFSLALSCVKKETVLLRVCPPRFYENKTPKNDETVDFLNLLMNAEEGEAAQKKKKRKPDALVPEHADGNMMRSKVRKIELFRGTHPVFVRGSSALNLRWSSAMGRHFVAGCDLNGGNDHLTLRKGCLFFWISCYYGVCFVVVFFFR